MTNEQQAIVAIGSLSIDGILYDISFDGSFGTSMFLGNQSGANAARDSISSLLNSFVMSVYFPWPFPTLANGSGGGVNGTGTRYEITYANSLTGNPESPNRRDYYFSEYGAGWVYPPSIYDFSLSEGSVEASFREAIPGSIPDTIPEPTMVTLLAGSAAMLIRRRNRPAIA